MKRWCWARNNTVFTPWDAPQRTFSSETSALHTFQAPPMTSCQTKTKPNQKSYSSGFGRLLNRIAPGINKAHQIKLYCIIKIKLETISFWLTEGPLVPHSFLQPDCQSFACGGSTLPLISNVNHKTTLNLFWLVSCGNWSFTSTHSADYHLSLTLSLTHCQFSAVKDGQSQNQSCHRFPIPWCL